MLGASLQDWERALCLLAMAKCVVATVSNQNRRQAELTVKRKGKRGERGRTNGYVCSSAFAVGTHCIVQNPRGTAVENSRGERQCMLAPPLEGVVGPAGVEVCGRDAGPVAYAL